MKPRSALALGLAAVLLAGCARSPAPNRYQALASAPLLGAGGEGDGARAAFTYEAPGAALSRYRSVRFLPVTVYAGADHQFGDLAEADRARLGAYASRVFRTALARKGLLAAPADPHAVLLEVTLTGAQASVPVLATASRLTPVGGAVSGLHAAAGTEGGFSGVVVYAVEVRDPRTGTILWAYVSKQFPNALDITTTFGPLDAAEAGLRDGADELAAALAARLGH